ncbi:MAG: ABC transporter ATP-binding protein [Candidatus Krumholzibacteriales bacterium]
MIELKNIDIKYDGKDIFRGFDFSVGKGEKVALLGKSGIGKSTLFNLILGFVRPAAGEVIVDGVPVDEESIWDIRRRIAYVDQDVSIGDGTAAGFLHSAFQFKANAGREFPEEQLGRLLEYFEADEALLRKNIEELSGGERQRLAIILAVLLERELFLLDEITSALDRDLKKKTAELFAGNEGWTVMVISHDPVWVTDPRVKIYDLEKEQWKQ